MKTVLSPLMSLAQQGLYVEPGNNSHYLECLWPASVSVAQLKQALNVARQPIKNVYIQIGFGAQAWQRLTPSFTPEHLTPFTQLNGKNGKQMPSTQGDIWFWIHGEDRGEVMDAVVQVQLAIHGLLDVQLDLSGFKNREARDLTGFVDGTANPEADERAEVAQIGLDHVGAGGSYVFSQQWQHDLVAFNQLAVSEQEKVFGRTKQDNIEMDDDQMPENSHVSRTDVSVNGVAQEIYRRSTPYGGAQKHGLYFLAFSCDPARIHIQLERMLGNTEDGLSDRLMDFTQAITGAYWFLPAQKDLDQLLA